MEWYIWVLQAWLAIMLLLALSGLLSFKGLRDYLLTINEVVGTSGSIILVLSIHNSFFGFSSANFILMFTLVVGLSLVVSMLSDFFKSPEEVRERELEVGKAVIEATNAARDNGANHIEAGLSGALAAEEEKKWEIAELGISLLLLLPNLISVVIGIGALS